MEDQPERPASGPAPASTGDEDAEARREALRARCRRLAGHAPSAPSEALADLARWCAERELAWDRYGRGLVLEALEEDVAARFGKPAGLFLPTGTMAQQIALRLWTERVGTPRVALPPHSHLELHEHDAHVVLSGLEAVPLGVFERFPGVDDLAAVEGPLAAVLLELPARELGGVLPAWDDLLALVAAAHERGARVHLDGARAFEAAAGYGLTPAQLAAPFDSVYVSLYKGIGGFAGAVLLGEPDWIDAARVWKRRYGGDPLTLLPFAASAHMHLDARAARMQRYAERGRELARAFAGVDGVRVDPPDPRAGMLHLVLAAPPEAVVAARDAVAEERGLWVLNDPRAAVPGDPPGSTRVELSVGDATLEVDVEEAVAALREVARRAAARA